MMQTKPGPLARHFELPSLSSTLRAATIGGNVNHRRVIQAACSHTLGLAGVLYLAGCGSASRTAAWEKETTPSHSQAAGASQAAREPGDASGEDSETEALWNARDDKQKLMAAIQAWESRIQQAPADTEALTRLSRAYYFLVDAFLNIEGPENLDELRLKYHSLGADYGERALLAVDPQFGNAMRAGADFIEAISKIEAPAVPSAYWYCANLGRFAVAKGLSAKLFYKDRLAAAMRRIRELQPTFFYNAADRYLGAFYAALPGIAGKDLDKSAEHFAAAQSQSPQYLSNLVVQAEFLAVEQDDQQMYESLLQRVLAAPDGEDPNVAPENRAAKRTARKLLQPEAIDERF